MILVELKISLIGSDEIQKTYSDDFISDFLNLLLDKFDFLYENLAMCDDE